MNQQTEIANDLIGNDDVVVLPSPEELKRAIRVSNSARAFLFGARQTVQKILSGQDRRRLCIVGPCSIHDATEAKAYTERLRLLADEVSDELYLVMRVYIQKPRTTIGWQGLSMDPWRDGSADIKAGLVLCRELMAHIAEIGLPVATEALDPMVHSYVDDLVSWAAIGARTAESPTHRQLASALWCPVGFKNGTDGSLSAAINGIVAAQHPQQFIRVDGSGKTVVERSQGNPDAHLILRGGTVPNYDPASVQTAKATLAKRGLHPAIVIDCSHGNSGKDHRMQKIAFESALEQMLQGEHAIRGVMLESNLAEGQQEPDGTLLPGVSITDSCIGFDETESLITDAARRFAVRKLPIV